MLDVERCFRSIIRPSSSTDRTHRCFLVSIAASRAIAIDRENAHANEDFPTASYVNLISLASRNLFYHHVRVFWPADFRTRRRKIISARAITGGVTFADGSANFAGASPNYPPVAWGNAGAIERSSI